MPFSKDEQRAVTRARQALDRIPVDGSAGVGGLPMIPTSQRPDAYVPAQYAAGLDATLARDQRSVDGMDPRDWTRELDKPVIDARWSRLALTYMQACSRARVPMRVREYWTALWAMADAGLVVPGTVVGTTLNNLPYPSPAFCDATPAELAERHATRADVDAYTDTLARMVAAGAFSRVSRYKDLGAQMLAMGFAGRYSEMMAEGWTQAQGLTPAVLLRAAGLARACIAETFAEFGLDTPEHGLHVVGAWNDGSPEWPAAAFGMALAKAAPPETSTGGGQSGGPSTGGGTPSGTPGGGYVGSLPGRSLGLSRLNTSSPVLWLALGVGAFFFLDASRS